MKYYADVQGKACPMNDTSSSKVNTIMINCNHPPYFLVVYLAKRVLVGLFGLN